MKKIILPTDFSKNANNAIRYAVQLQKGIKTTFYLVHTYTPPIVQVEYLFHSPSQVGLGDPYKTRKTEQLNEIKKELEEQFGYPEHTFVTRAAFNTLTDEIANLAKHENADLVIMGTQGATGAKEILLGTNTTQVIGKATCPVIAIPSEFEYRAPAEILFPSDYEIDFKSTDLQVLTDLTKNHGSNIDLLHVSSGQSLSEEQLRNKQKLKAILEDIDHRINDLPDHGIIEAVNRFLTNNEVDLLVMVQNKYTFLERMFVEPVIKKIGFHIHIPFMVIPHNT